MSLYDIHVFICQNERDESDPRGCCLHKGSQPLLRKLKAEVKERELQNRIRINAAGCLGSCKQGVSMVIYPQGIWYGKISETDLPEILEKTLLRGEIIDRLLMPFMKSKTPRSK